MISRSSFKSKKRREQLANIIAVIILVAVAAVVMLPLWWMFRSSLMRSLEIFKWPPRFFPPEWLFSNYIIKKT
ncbi:MAG: hypothetical protein FWD25_13475, partial [Clostridia bacterium]|nr:hypothetical protein [Clostridia bacterium]